MSELSRRELIVKAGAVALGAAVVQLGCGLRHKPNTEAGAVASGAADVQLGNVGPKASAAVDPKKWPWPYEKLDPAKTAEIAYNEWYRVYCGASVISSVFSQLAEKVGEPYKSFPVDGFFFLLGGIADWGTVCGTGAGANIVANLIVGPPTSGDHAGFTIGSNLMEYYGNTMMPVFVPKNPKIDPAKIVQTQSDSPLCHISLGKWMKASGFPKASAERKERCSRLAATMAYQLVKNLNAWKDGKYDENIKWDPAEEVGINAQQNCTDCHGSSVPTAKR
jgi:hypothetical protein